MVMRCSPFSPTLYNSYTAEIISKNVMGNATDIAVYSISMNVKKILRQS